MDNNDEKHDINNGANPNIKKSSNEIAKEFLNEIKGNFKKGEKLQLKNVSINIYNNFHLSKMKLNDAIRENPKNIEENQKKYLKKEEKNKYFQKNETNEISTTSEDKRMSQSFCYSNSDNLGLKNKNTYYENLKKNNQNLIVKREDQFFDQYKKKNESTIQVNTEEDFSKEFSNFNSEKDNVTNQNLWTVDNISKSNEIMAKMKELNKKRTNEINKMGKVNFNDNPINMKEIKGVFNSFSKFNNPKMNQSFGLPHQQIIDEWD